MRPRLILAACGLCLAASAAHGQSLRDRLREVREEVREAATTVEQEADALAEAASGDDPASAAPPPPATPAASTAAGGVIVDLEPFIRQAAEIANECRGFPDNEFKPGCLKQCDDTVAILSRARGQPVPPGAEAQAREAVRVCGVMRDYARDPANAGR